MTRSKGLYSIFHIYLALFGLLPHSGKLAASNSRLISYLLRSLNAKRRPLSWLLWQKPWDSVSLDQLRRLPSDQSLRLWCIDQSLRLWLSSLSHVPSPGGRVAPKEHHGALTKGGLSWIPGKQRAQKQTGVSSSWWRSRSQCLFYPEADFKGSDLP